MSQEVRHCLRNLTELCNLETAGKDSEITEALLDFVMDGKLRLIYDKGEVLFQSPEVNRTQ